MRKEICKICGVEYVVNRFSQHLKIHNITLQEYYDKFYKKDGEGICLNCGKESVFKGLRGYGQYCSKKCVDNSPIKKERTNNTKKNFSDEKWKEIDKKSKETRLQKYGDQNYRNVEKIKRTKKERYDDENYNNIEKGLTTKRDNGVFENIAEKLKIFYENQPKEFFENITNKVKKTKLERYGDENYNNKEQIKKTNLEKYGYEEILKNPNIRDQIKKTHKERYGAQSYLGTEESIEERKNRDKENRMNSLTEIGLKNNAILISFGVNEATFLCNKCELNFTINNQLLYRRVKRNVEICLNCSPLYVDAAYSKEEKQILEIVKENYYNTIKENDRNVLELELDIYLPNDNLAFEFNGIYWHSSDHKKSYYHKYKTNLCEQNNIHLIHIYEDDWMFKSNIVESNILKLLHSSPILYPNSYIVKEISLTISLDFLENNSLQFDKVFEKSFGLFSNNSLVYVLTLNKNKINNISETIKYTVNNAFQIVFNYLKENLQYDSYKLILDRSWYKTQESFGEFRFNKYIKEKSFFIINNKREESKQEEVNERILKIYNSGYLEYIWSREENKNA